MRLIGADDAERLYALMGSGTREVSGGSAANTIVGVAGFGARAAFVGKVKNDKLGQAFANDIRKAGVAFDTPPAKDGPSTACCYVMVTPELSSIEARARVAGLDLARYRDPRIYAKTIGARLTFGETVSGFTEVVRAPRVRVWRVD